MRISVGNRVGSVAIALVVVLALLAAACSSDPAAEVVGAVAANPTATVAAPTALALLEPTTAPVSTPPPPLPTPLDIPPTPTPRPVEQRTMLFSGDVLSHTPVIATALAYGDGDEWPYDYRPMFDGVRSRVSAVDLAICVLETPVSPDNTGLDGYPTFNAPRELPDALVDAGYDGCSTASNHSMDRGASGVRTTLEEMDRAGLAHAGMARTEDEASTPTIYDLDGVRVAHLSFTYGLNGFVLPADEPWLVDVNDVAAIASQAETARTNGADVVVLSIQWGNEYQRMPSDEQYRLAREITSLGTIDLIVGNHAHVVQPIDRVNDVPVIYGLGNSLSNQFDNQNRTGTQDGLMVEATLAGNVDVGWSVALAAVPTWVDRSSYTIVDVAEALADPTLGDGQRQILQASFDRTVEAIALLGADVPLAQ